MLSFLQGPGHTNPTRQRGHGWRKLKLFAIACCRHVWSFLTDERSRRAVEANEQYLEQLTSQEERRAAEAAARQALDEKWQATREARRLAEDAHDREQPFYAWYAKKLEAEYALTWLAGSLGDLGEEQAADGAAWVKAWPTGGAKAEEERWQCDALRDVFANPVRPFPALDPAVLAWNDGCVSKTAAAIYQASAFHRMSALAYLLQEAGCQDPDIIAHCRGNGPHVRGCWALAGSELARASRIVATPVS